jgi:hypothetical protein
MVKIILAAICMMSATLAGLYVPGLLQRTSDRDGQELLAKPEAFKSDHIAVAIFENGKVAGYFTSRLNCELTDPSSKASILAKLTHELYKAVHSSADVNFRKPGSEQLSALADKITKDINESAGRPVIDKLTIDEPDFLRRL